MDTFYAPLSVRINRVWLYYSCLQLGLDFSCIGANNKEVSVPCQLTSLPPLNRKASISSEVKYKNQKISLIHHHIFIILHISTYIWHSTPSSMQDVSLQASSLGFSGGGPEKEGELATIPLWNLSIYMGKVDTKCWLAEMTLVIMISLPLMYAFTCFSIFVYIWP